MLPQDDKEARKILLMADEFRVEKGALYHLYVPRTRRLDRAMAVMRQLCVPLVYRTQIAMAFHDNNGHPGADRLYSTCRLKYWWAGMYSDLSALATNCLECQKAKIDNHPTRVPVQPMQIGMPCTTWYIDYHGRFPRTKDGSKFVLTVICSSSLWCELIPVRSTDAEHVVRALFNHVVARYGIPKSLSVVNDNASGYTFRLATLFAKTFNIRRYFSTPHHHSSVCGAEAVADFIHKSLRIVTRDQTDWDQHLQAIALAYRSTVNLATGMSPFQIVFGRQMCLPID